MKKFFKKGTQNRNIIEFLIQKPNYCFSYNDIMFQELGIKKGSSRINDLLKCGIIVKVGITKKTYYGISNKFLDRIKKHEEIKLDIKNKFLGSTNIPNPNYKNIFQRIIAKLF